MLGDVTMAPLAELEELSRADVHSVADLAAIALGLALAARDETVAALRNSGVSSWCVRCRLRVSRVWKSPRLSGNVTILMLG